MADHIDTGKTGEAIAAEYLLSKGYTILEKNWHNHHQEIDIIAVKDNEMAIVEVKCRKGTPLIEPYASVTISKQKLLIKAANAYILHNNIDLETRFDIISIVIGQEVIIEHIENAFYPKVR